MNEPGLDAAYALETAEDNLKLYRNWANTYDQEFAENHGYVLPLRVAEAFAAAGGSGPVIDLGAGTGLCGEALRRLGVAPVDATDLSREMLDVAEAKNIYTHLFAGDMLDRLPVDDGAYAGAVSSGTFTHGHVGPDALAEVLRILRPDGLGCLSINSAHYGARGFDARFAQLADQVDDLRLDEVSIYRAGLEGAHAADTAFVVTFRRK